MNKGNNMDSIKLQIQRASAAQKYLALVSEEKRNAFLSALSQSLLTQKERIFEANRSDVQAASEKHESGPLVKRLKFDEQKLHDVREGIEQIISLKDPVHQVLAKKELDTGLILSKVTTPIGVIGMIFESRPDALIQIVSLCVKSGNAIVLKGGSEALLTNRVLADICKQAAADTFPENIGASGIVLLETREAVGEMLTMNDEIDLIIPRGSNAFVRYIMEHTTVPVLGHADGICHCYIDNEAAEQTAVAVAVDSKCQYPAACNAIETILIHADIAQSILPKLRAALTAEQVLIRGDERVRRIIECEPAVEEDWSTEYLDLIVSVKIVDSLEEAVVHINTYGSGHTDCIVTGSQEHADLFMDAVDSADVFTNCSTRFADGFRFGLGAEVGISTHKIHARGPVGLEGLISYKWKLQGHGHIAADYTGPDAKSYTHRDLPANE